MPLPAAALEGEPGNDPLPGSHGACRGPRPSGHGSSVSFGGDHLQDRLQKRRNIFIPAGPGRCILRLLGYIRAKIKGPARPMPSKTGVELAIGLAAESSIASRE